MYLLIIVVVLLSHMNNQKLVENSKIKFINIITNDNDDRNDD